MSDPLQTLFTMAGGMFFGWLFRAWFAETPVEETPSCTEHNWRREDRTERIDYGKGCYTETWSNVVCEVCGERNWKSKYFDEDEN